MTATILAPSLRDPAKCSRSCVEADPRLAHRCCCQCHGRNHSKGVDQVDSPGEDLFRDATKKVADHIADASKMVAP